MLTVMVEEDVAPPYGYERLNGTVKSSAVSTGAFGSQSDLVHRISRSSLRVFREIRSEFA
jgi:hypothetical protein